MCNYVCEKTFYVAHENIYEFTSDLSNDFRILNKWFCDNYKLLNIDKCYFMALKSSSNLWLLLQIVKIPIGKKILEIAIENKLDFLHRVRNIYKVANQMVSTIFIISNYID